MIKLLYWKDDVNYSKHLHDIDNWIETISYIRLKPDTKKVSEKNLYEWMFNGPFGNGAFVLEKIIKNMKDYHQLPKSGITIDALYLKLVKIYKSISKDVFNDKFTTIQKYL